jgi:hypothetical protein
MLAGLVEGFVKPISLCLFVIGIVAAGWLHIGRVRADEMPSGEQMAVTFPPELSSYQDTEMGFGERLAHRIRENPFNLVATMIFLLAIAHTFMSSRLLALSERLEQRHVTKIAQGGAPLHSVSHSGRLLHFLGEVEVIFGLWVQRQCGDHLPEHPCARVHRRNEVCRCRRRRNWGRANGYR